VLLGVVKEFHPRFNILCAKRLNRVPIPLALFSIDVETRSGALIPTFAGTSFAYLFLRRPRRDFGVSTSVPNRAIPLTLESAAGQGFIDEIAHGDWRARDPLLKRPRRDAAGAVGLARSFSSR